MKKSKAIDVHNLMKQYPNGTKGLSDFTLSIERGQVIGLVGPNGSGKTTTINVLTTTFPPTSGNGTILGYDLINESHQIRQLIGLVPQYESIDWSLTVEQNLQIFAQLLGIDSPAQQIGELLEMLELKDKRKASMEEISGGQIRRVMLARAFLFPAQLLFVDEPTVGLDPVGVERVLSFIKLQTKKGITIVIASNIMEEIQAICDRIVFISKGQKYFEGTVSEIIGQFQLTEQISIHARNATPSQLLEQLKQNGMRIMNHDPLVVEGVKISSTILNILPPFIANGYQLESFSIEPPTLRDAFLELANISREEEPNQ